MLFVLDAFLTKLTRTVMISVFFELVEKCRTEVRATEHLVFNGSNEINAINGIRFLRPS